MWLVSKQYDDTAIKSLRWLRGWVPQTVIQDEFDSIKRHKEFSNSCDDCKKAVIKCTHQDMQKPSIKELIQKKTMKPFLILMVLGSVAFFSGTHHLTAYMVQILNTYRSPISPNLATVIVSVTGLGGTFAGIFGLKMWGKRKLFLFALLGVTISSFTLG